MCWVFFLLTTPVSTWTVIHTIAKTMLSTFPLYRYLLSQNYDYPGMPEVFMLASGEERQSELFRVNYDSNKQKM